MTTETLNFNPLYVTGSGVALMQCPHSDAAHTHRILSCAGGGQVAVASRAKLSYSIDGGTTWMLWKMWNAGAVSPLVVTAPSPITIDYSVASEKIQVMLAVSDTWDEQQDPGGSKLRNPNPSELEFTSIKIDAEIGGEINSGLCKIEPLFGF